MDTWGSLHAGDVVLSTDGYEWGVLSIGVSRLSVAITLVRHGVQATAAVPGHLPVIVVRRADTSEEYRAAAALLAAGLMPELIQERWES